MCACVCGSCVCECAGGGVFLCAFIFICGVCGTISAWGDVIITLIGIVIGISVAITVSAVINMLIF